MFNLAEEVTQVLDSIAWVRCACGNVIVYCLLLLLFGFKAISLRSAVVLTLTILLFLLFMVYCYCCLISRQFRCDPLSFEHPRNPSFFIVNGLLFGFTVVRTSRQSFLFLLFMFFVSFQSNFVAICCSPNIPAILPFVVGVILLFYTGR